MTAIISGIGKAATSIVSVGKNIVTGLWSGVSSMISWVKNKISGFVGDIVGGIKSLLGIHSPSRVFAGIGDNMVSVRALRMKWIRCQRILTMPFLQTLM